MKQQYLSPELTDFGDIADVTGIFGTASIQDVLLNPAGQVVQEGTGSINACPTMEFENCVFE